MRNIVRLLFVCVQRHINPVRKEKHKQLCWQNSTAVKDEASHPKLNLNHEQAEGKKSYPENESQHTVYLYPNGKDETEMRLNIGG